MGFAQQCGLVGSVQICVFGDGVQGKGSPSPASAMEKPGIVGFRNLFGGDNATHTLCEWLRMKFLLAFYNGSRQRRPVVTSFIAQHAMF